DEPLDAVLGHAEENARALTPGRTRAGYRAGTPDRPRARSRSAASARRELLQPARRGHAGARGALGTRGPVGPDHGAPRNRTLDVIRHGVSGARKDWVSKPFAGRNRKRIDSPRCEHVTIRSAPSGVTVQTSESTWLWDAIASPPSVSTAPPKKRWQV